MKKILTLLFSLALLAACSGGDGEGKGPGGPGGPGAKGKGGPGGRQGGRQIAVEVYVATLNKQAREYQTMATLQPMNGVSLAAATSGRLMQLKAKDGANVSKGDLLAKIDDSELKAQQKQSESNKSLVEQKYNRTKSLYEKDGATKEELEAAEAGLKSAQANLELVKAQIAKTEIRAPFSGKLGLVNISEGAWLTTGAPVAELSEVDKLKAIFALPQRFAASVKVGDKVTILDEDRNIKREGKIKALDATISESSRTRQIMVELDNKKGDFLAGGYAKVIVTLSEQNAPVMSIPSEALTLDKDGAYVFVVKEGKAAIKHVETSLRTPISVDVTKGLDEGDSVVVSGLMSMRPGVGIRVKEVRHQMNYEVGK